MVEVEVMVVGDPHMLSLLVWTSTTEEEVPLWQRPGWELLIGKDY